MQAWQGRVEGIPTAEEIVPPLVQAGQAFATTKVVKGEHYGTGPLGNMAHIHRAARLGTFEEVLAALATENDVDMIGIHHFTPLMLAAREGHLPIVKLLLERGANPNLAHPNGRSVLHFAAGAGQEEVVCVLLTSGANVNAVSKRGDSPVIEAAHFNHTNVVNQLRQHGADMEHRDKQGRTADDWLSGGGVPGLFKKTFGERSKS